MGAGAFLKYLYLPILHATGSMVSSLLIYGYGFAFPIHYRPIKKGHQPFPKIIGLRIGGDRHSFTMQ